MSSRGKSVRARVLGQPIEVSLFAASDSKLNSSLQPTPKPMIFNSFYCWSIRLSFSTFAVLLAGVFLGTAVDSSIASTITKSDQGQTRIAKTLVVLSYIKDPENELLKSFDIQITRNDQTLGRLPLPVEQLPGSFYTQADLRAISADVKVIDLDGDGEAEVVVDLALAGAYCCSASFIYGYTPSGHYQALTQFWGNYTSGYWIAGLTGKEGDRLLSDRNGDGNLEFTSLDDRFRGEFGAYATSAAPVRILRYQSGKLVDVTKEFPQEIRRSATATWRQYQQIRQEFSVESAQGAMAAYVGAKILLGEEADAMQRLNQAYPGSRGEAFKKKLRVFLQQTGYLKSGS